MSDTAKVRPIKGRTPPHDLDAEAALLGAMLLSTQATVTALGIVSAEDFYKPAHGHIFDAIAECYAGGEATDPVTVAAALRARGLLEAAGGSAELVSLQAGTPSTTAVGTYARITAEHARRRRIIGIGAELVEAAYATDDEGVGRAIEVLGASRIAGRSVLMPEDVSEPGPALEPSLLWMEG